MKLEGWQGLPNINEVKRYESGLSSKFSLFFKSWKRRAFVYLVCSGIKRKSVSEVNSSFSSDKNSLNSG